MPKYRQLHCKIVESFSVNNMPDDFTRLVWVLLPIALDSEGRGIYNPTWVKSKIMPLRCDVTDGIIGQAMEWFNDHGMIISYFVNGDPYFYIPTWRKYQMGTEKEAPSHLPAPPQDNPEISTTPVLLQSNSRVTPDLLQSKSASIQCNTMQEQDNAGAPDLLPTSSDPFDAMQAMVEQNLGYPCQTTEDIIAINKFIQAGVQESDIQDALAFFTSNGRVARSAAHIEKSVMTSLGKRVQAANARAGPNGSKPSLADLGYTNISPTFSDAEIQSMLSKHTTEDE